MYRRYEKLFLSLFWRPLKCFIATLLDTENGLANKDLFMYLEIFQLLDVHTNKFLEQKLHL